MCLGAMYPAAPINAKFFIILIIICNVYYTANGLSSPAFTTGIFPCYPFGTFILMLQYTCFRHLPVAEWGSNKAYNIRKDFRDKKEILVRKYPVCK